MNDDTLNRIAFRIVNADMSKRVFMTSPIVGELKAILEKFKIPEKLAEEAWKTAKKEVY